MPSPHPRPVRAGPVNALLDGAFLRRIRVGPHEVVRGVYAAVRDQHWGTVEPTFSRYSLEEDADSFRLRFTANHRQDDIDFVWDGEYVGEATGRIVCRFDGVCRTAFRKNRIGFCVLHPPELAGTPYVRQTPAGPIEERFPERISPRRDVADMEAIRYQVGPIGVELRFQGARFDMEDQRNWTDASYKTFCTPLALPYPVQMEAGQRISQTVTLDLRVPPGVAAGASMPLDETAGGGPDVVVGADAIGALPPFGLGASFDGRPLGQGAVERLRALRPAHLRVEVDLRGTAWREGLRVASADAGALGAGLDVAVLTDEAGSGIEALVAALAASPASVVRSALFSEQDWVTVGPLVARARAAGLPGSIGGGSRTDFAQFNMQQTRIPFAALDFATYAINPQVHAFDDLSIVETLGVQAATVASARALAGDRPIVVGPVTLRPRFNPNATAPEPPPLPGASPPQVDPRQTAPFAAAWTVGSIHRLAGAGAAALTYFEAAGPCGVVDTSGAPYPLCEMLAEIAPLAGAALLDVTLRDPLTFEALALRRACPEGRRDVRVLVVVANLTPERRTCSLALPSGQHRVLDLEPYATTRIVDA